MLHLRISVTATKSSRSMGPDDVFGTHRFGSELLSIEQVNAQI
jgi:hypothetical protein